MELQTILRSRRSVRRYLAREVPLGIIAALLEAANLAPSGANASPWLYVVVTAPSLKSAIRQASEAADRRWNAAQGPAFQAWLAQQGITGEKPFLEDAPVLLAVFSDARAPYAVESTWLSLAFLILAAVELDLGTLTYTPGDPAFLGPLLGVPGHYQPQAILPVGYPGEAADPSRRPKRPVSATARLNRYDLAFPGPPPTG